MTAHTITLPPLYRSCATVAKAGNTLLTVARHSTTIIKIQNETGRVEKHHQSPGQPYIARESKEKLYVHATIKIKKQMNKVPVAVVVSS